MIFQVMANRAATPPELLDEIENQEITKDASEPSILHNSSVKNKTKKEGEEDTSSVLEGGQTKPKKLELKVNQLDPAAGDSAKGSLNSSVSFIESSSVSTVTQPLDSSEELQVKQQNHAFQGVDVHFLLNSTVKKQQNLAVHCVLNPTLEKTKNAQKESNNTCVETPQDPSYDLSGSKKIAEVKSNDARLNDCDEILCSFDPYHEKASQDHEQLQKEEHVSQKEEQPGVIQDQGSDYVPPEIVKENQEVRDNTDTNKEHPLSTSPSYVLSTHATLAQATNPACDGVVKKDACDIYSQGKTCYEDSTLNTITTVILSPPNFVPQNSPEYLFSGNTISSVLMSFDSI